MYQNPSILQMQTKGGEGKNYLRNLSYHVARGKRIKSIPKKKGEREEDLQVQHPQFAYETQTR